MVSGAKENRAVLFFPGGVAASRIPLVPASEQSPCRQPGSAWPAAAGGCLRSEPLPAAGLHLLKTSQSCFASKMCHSGGAGMGKARMKQNWVPTSKSQNEALLCSAAICWALRDWCWFKYVSYYDGGAAFNCIFLLVMNLLSHSSSC